jgi:hypothetical protein
LVPRPLGATPSRCHARHRPSVGQCDEQPGFPTALARTDHIFLYNLKEDPHELHDLGQSEPAQLARLTKLLLQMRTSIMFSRVNETKCEGTVPDSVSEELVSRFWHF